MKRKLLLLSLLAFCIICSNCSIKASADQYGQTKAYTQMDLPVVQITTENNAQPSTDKSQINGKISIIDENGSSTLDNMDMKIRLRGNSSLYCAKKSYKISFEKKQNLLNIGTGGGKSWGLIANYYDSSNLRNAAAYQMASMLTGSPYAVKFHSVDVYLNGDYQGAYLLTELVNVNKNRVAIKESVDKVEGNGYLLQMTSYAEDSPFTIGSRKYEIKSDLSEDSSIQKQQHDYIAKYVETCMNALKQDSQTEAEKYIDIASLVDNYIGFEVAKNVDVGWDSFYLYKDAYGKLIFGPMWDFDLSFGNNSAGAGVSSYKGLNPRDVLDSATNSNPWFTTALSCQWFRTLVQNRYNELKSDLETLPGFVTAEAQKNYNSYNRNLEKWGANTTTFFTSSEIARLKTFKEHYTYLSNWIENRIAWLTDYFNTEDFINGRLLDNNGNVLTPNSSAGTQNTPFFPWFNPFPWTTSSPAVSSSPVVSKAPVVSPSPKASPSPAATKTPVISPSPVASKTPAVSSVPSSKGVSVKLTVSNSWDSGAVCNITVTNQSGKDFTNGWTLSFDFNRTVTSLWSANLVSSTNGHCIITNPDWQKSLASGESYTFGCQVGAGNDFQITNAAIK
ncbi:CotH kinase family protein [[Clostridium] polysaccharolyticum]|uniref:Cellulose binding domain-containing protein n=1 Tax=[Clostridium] polysaccharolyticum TaxID=29364 RepID=A0A1I0F9Z2_9FIRM|nr:CotH kinase family protein [[Clostridium] polysaccharolyticum]SET55017.1 Cellulose binding domain-containing protein [[Clostridium] polysaccharolyticum]